eukprot:CAMPEP_0179137272 /NCGR_PEP_ID=MMETSP0796-20121207/65476_1 /TAXON_ID=73915 /ORGANISM="Pyrodinium bahamense, Strain pbaha01" /LENGTH=160 /DNA_ID=CAMNT_0020836441 /DNA_START=149 /DNA_END=631 /DNA_ORIENTATION=-
MALAAARPLSSDLSWYELMTPEGVVVKDAETRNSDRYTAVVKTRRVERVRMRTGDLIDLIEFQYSDGTVESNGNRIGGGECEPFELAVGEFIVAVDYREGDMFDAICFKTNEGRSSRYYGNPQGGREFHFEAPAGEQIWNVERWPGYCGKVKSFVTKRIP